MKNIKVTLLHHTPLYIASDGARTCWASQDKSDTISIKQCGDCESTNINSIAMMCNDCNSDRVDIIKPIGPKDLALLDRVGNQFHHGSILEHISFNFFIDGISRACLQEWSRHRHMSQSVESTRYTMAKELKEESSFFEKYKHDPSFMTGRYGDIQPSGLARAEKYIHLTRDNDVDYASICALENLRELVIMGKANDKAKYALPECWRVRLTASINLRSLQNFLSLRTDRKALPEIQHLARLIYQALPVEAQSLVAHCVKEPE
jgi:thymidylate synthase (FAD)